MAHSAFGMRLERRPLAFGILLGLVQRLLAFGILLERLGLHPSVVESLLERHHSVFVSLLVVARLYHSAFGIRLVVVQRLPERLLVHPLGVVGLQSVHLGLLHQDAAQ